MVVENLSWKQQVQKVRRTIIYKLSILRCIRTYIPTSVRLTFYNYYIKPYFDQCCSVWGNCSKEDSDTLLKLQKQAARLIIDAHSRASSDSLFEQLHWLPQNSIEFHQALLMYKSLTNLAPDYMSSLFHFTHQPNTQNLRSASTNTLFIPRTHHRSSRYKGPKLWNSLDNRVTSAQSLTQFKIIYHKHTA